MHRYSELHPLIIRREEFFPTKVGLENCGNEFVVISQVQIFRFLLNTAKELFPIEVTIDLEYPAWLEEHGTQYEYRHRVATSVSIFISQQKIGSLFHHCDDDFSMHGLDDFCLESSDSGRLLPVGDRIRFFIVCIRECCKRIEKMYPGGPSTEFILWTLPAVLRPYFPNDFDWNAPHDDVEVALEISKRRSTCPRYLEWLKEMPYEHNGRYTYSKEEMPRFFRLESDGNDSDEKLNREVPTSSYRVSRVLLKECHPPKITLESDYAHVSVGQVHNCNFYCEGYDRVSWTDFCLELEFKFYNDLWSESDNKQFVTKPSPSKTLVDIVVYPRGERSGLFVRRYSWGREDRSCSICRSKQTRCFYCDGFRVDGCENAVTNRLPEFEGDLRLYMNCIFDACKLLSSQTDPPVVYPSTEYIMRSLPSSLHAFFPSDFDWKASHEDRKTVADFCYRPADNLAEWVRTIPDEESFLEEYSVEDLPRYRRNNTNLLRQGQSETIF